MRLLLRLIFHLFGMMVTIKDEEIKRNTLLDGFTVKVPSAVNCISSCSYLGRRMKG